MEVYALVARERSCRAFFLTSVVHRYEDTRPNKENPKAVTVDPAALKMLPRAELRQYINDVGLPNPCSPNADLVRPVYVLDLLFRSLSPIEATEL
jgi:hypothetical protein